jgi:hypothetical protein
MEKYRFFFLDDHSHIQAVQIIEAANDEAAGVQANALLNGQQEYPAAELWHFGRQVAVLKR